MFETVTLCPPDAVFGLTEEFKRDPNPDKVNLTVGVYCDEQGRVPIMRSVQEVEQRMLDEQQGHSYLPIDGLPGYDQWVAELILGSDHPVIQQQRFATVQTPGGTGALRIAGEVLRRVCGVSRIWVSNPTWSNHLQIFRAAGLELKTYNYLDERGTGLDFSSVCQGIDSADAGDAVLVHTVCHNPTGVDLDAEQWGVLLQLITDKQLFPIFDFAYQGFGSGLEADAEPIRRFVNGGTFQGEALICSSFSKNFNLYGERVGGLTVTASAPDAARAMLSQLKSIVRTTYSNPPRHGGAIVEQVLGDDDLRADWENELDGIRERIQALREAFVDRMAEKLPGVQFDHIRRQRGMFSYSGISANHVDRLKREYGVYLLGSGRINIAGLNQKNLDYVCTAIAAVLG